LQLSQLLSGIDAERLDTGDPEIAGVACDSRSVRPGFLFAAVRGARADGHDHLEAAAQGGATACLIQEDRPAFGMARVRVPDSEVALGLAAAAFWDHPSARLRLVGITGTNGKTTTAYLIQHILQRAGLATGRLGTISYAFPSAEEPAPLTTPDAPTLQAGLARMVREGAQAVVMEVSSHALVRNRVAGCRFACTVFTNLSQDHLDYHGTMEEYFAGKRLLFTRFAPRAPATINAEDAWGQRLLAEVPDPRVSWGLERGDVRLALTDLSPRGLRGEVHYPGGRAPVEAPLVGAFNAQNVCCALATAHALGLDVGAAARAVASAPPVPGRLEPVANTLGITVLVDYAHTPDALDRALEAVRAVCSGRLLCVFGCGGDRDRGKRPLMARAAAHWADALVLTADNSRSEATEAILEAIEAGLPKGWTRAEGLAELRARRHVYMATPDRAQGIRRAIAAAAPGDAVLIAGKGHETTQTLGTRVLPFDDRVEARTALGQGQAA